jgi:hypothetical protein
MRIVPIIFSVFFLYLKLENFPPLPPFGINKNMWKRFGLENYFGFDTKLEVFLYSVLRRNH